MIFLDANVFLRYLVRSPDPKNAEMTRLVGALFIAVERDEAAVTTSEVVLHEVCYVLCSKKQYGIPVVEVSEAVAAILQMPGFKLSKTEKQIYLDALELFAANPKLEFSDSVIAIRAHRLDIPLATFDKALLKLPIVTPWQPAGNGKT
jgi:predicted nucleic acid-binding protein